MIVLPWDYKHPCLLLHHKYQTLYTKGSATKSWFSGFQPQEPKQTNPELPLLTQPPPVYPGTLIHLNRDPEWDK